MKKYFALLAFTSILAFSACNKEKKVEEPEPIAPDLVFFDLKGPVHELTDLNNDMKYVFDKDGTLLTIDGRNPFNEELLREYNEETGIMIEHPRLNRDTVGQIVQQIMLEGEINYTWDDGHIVAEEGLEESMEWSSKYEYDAEGHLVKHTMQIWSVDEKPEDGETYTDEYVYDAFDSFGNWTSRKNKDNVETRAITYYEPTKQ